MRFDAYLVLDDEGKLEGKPVLSSLKELYNKFVVRSRIENYEAELHEELYEFLNEIKSFLNLYKFQGVDLREF